MLSISIYLKAALMQVFFILLLLIPYFKYIKNEKVRINKINSQLSPDEKLVFIAKKQATFTFYVITLSSLVCSFILYLFFLGGINTITTKFPSIWFIILLLSLIVCIFDLVDDYKNFFNSEFIVTDRSVIIKIRGIHPFDHMIKPSVHHIIKLDDITRISTINNVNYRCRKSMNIGDIIIYTKSKSYYAGNLKSPDEVMNGIKKLLSKSIKKSSKKSFLSKYGETAAMIIYAAMIQTIFIHLLILR